MARATLANRTEAESVIARLARCTPDVRRRWGTMSPQQMLCHVSDAFHTGLGEVSPKPLRVMGLRGPVAKWIALSLPVPWPHGIRGPAEVDPMREGTRPGAFDADLKRALAMARRFAADVGGQHPHPMFGPMTRADWLRWGWLHLDHHLRQFSL